MADGDQGYRAKDDDRYKDDDLVPTENQMLSSPVSDDHYKQYMPIDLGEAQGNYGVTVDEDRGYNLNAVADPGGISPDFELRQMKDDIATGKKHNDGIRPKDEG